MDVMTAHVRPVRLGARAERAHHPNAPTIAEKTARGKERPGRIGDARGKGWGIHRRMTASATDAVSRARELTQRRLFPFNLDKWLRVGFIAFIAGLGQSGGSGLGGQLPGLPGEKSSRSFDFDAFLRQAEEFLRANLGLVLLGVGFTYLFMTAIWALLLWLSSRGQFLFVESVIHDRTAFSEPWARLRVPAWQLFKARFVLGMVTGTLVLILLGFGAFLAWPDFRAAEYLAAGLRLLPFLFGVGVHRRAGRDLSRAAPRLPRPAMYLDGIGVGAAWKTFRASVLPGNLGALGTFYVIQVVLGLGAGMVTVLVTCLTCCLAALPYIGTVVLLPIPVFFRVYSLTMLEQLGRPVFPVAAPPEPFKGWF